MNLQFQFYFILMIAMYNKTAIINHETKRRSAFYFSENGDDTNEGSAAHPLKTIAFLNKMDLHAGDTLCLKGGESFNGTIIFDSIVSGSQEKPVIVTSYGNGKAIINAGDSSAISLYQANNLIFKNLTLVGSGRKKGNAKDGIAINHCNNIFIDNIDVSGFQKSGLEIYSCKNVLINEVRAHDNGAAGIGVEGINNSKLSSNNIHIMHCIAENNPGDPGNLTNHSGNGIVVGHCTNVLIEYCMATDNGWDMPRIGNGPVGIWCYEADSVIIDHCLSYRNKTSPGGADGGGFDLDGGVTNSLIQYCLSYENQGSGYCMFQYWGASPWHNNVIRFNISENDGLVSDPRAGAYVWNSSEDAKQFHDCDFYNNTIYNSKEAALSFSDKSQRKNFRFFNNIFIGKDSLIRGNEGNDKFLANDWWSIEKKI